MQIERRDPTQEGPPTINLAEMHLFNAAGAQYPSSRLRVTSSSSLDDSNYGPNKLVDGDSTSMFHSDNVNGITNPRVQVLYPCSEGLSKVEVVNRQECCQGRITAFQMRFLNSAGSDVTSAFSFGPTIGQANANAQTAKYTYSPGISAGV